MFKPLSMKFVLTVKVKLKYALQQQNNKFTCFPVGF